MRGIGLRAAAVALALGAAVPLAAQQYPVDASDIVVPPGFRVEVVAKGLDYPGDITFGPNGEMYVAEVGGHTYGTKPEKAPPARILQVLPGGETRVVYDNQVAMELIKRTPFGEPIPAKGLVPPLTGVTYNPENGLLYVASRARYATLNPRTGEWRTIIDGLPSWGEFLNTKAIFGPDGKMYFVQASQGNSGNVDGHWIKVIDIFSKPDAREVPCRDVEVTGLDFWMDNTLTPEKGDSVRSEVYVELGRNTEYGQVIPGKVPCNGAVMRSNPDGTGIELVAWGLRSLYGYRFSPRGRLVATQNSGNIMAPRPIYDDAEPVYEIVEGGWYGWPDYYSGIPITDPRFRRPNDPEWKGTPFEHDFSLTEETRRRLMRGELPIQPLLTLPIHSAAEGLVFGRSDWGMDPENEILVAEFGAIIPYYKDPPAWPGFRVQRANLTTGEITDFAINRCGKPAWAEGCGGGLRRPLQVAWGPDGALYIVDFGVIHFTEQGMNAVPGTGVVWKVVPTGEGVQRQPMPVRKGGG